MFISITLWFIYAPCCASNFSFYACNVDTKILQSIFFTTSFFTTSLSFSESIGTPFSLSISNLSTSNFNVFKSVVTVFNLAVSNICNFRPTKSNISSANVDVSRKVRFCYIVTKI